MTNSRNRKDTQLSEGEIARRRDEAVRRALNTPPKPYKDSKKGTREKREDDDRPTASGAKRT